MPDDKSAKRHYRRHPDRVAAEKPLLPFPPLQAIGHVPESVFKPNAVRIGLSHGRQFKTFFWRRVDSGWAAS